MSGNGRGQEQLCAHSRQEQDYERTVDTVTFQSKHCGLGGVRPPTLPATAIRTDLALVAKQKAVQHWPHPC